MIWIVAGLYVLGGGLMAYTSAIVDEIAAEKGWRGISRRGALIASVFWPIFVIGMLGETALGWLNTRTNPDGPSPTESEAR